MEPSPQASLVPDAASIIDSMTEAVILVDTAGTIRGWNRGAETMFGYGATEAMGATLDLIIPERMKAAHDEGFSRALASGQLRHAGRVLTTRAKHKQGQRLYIDFSFGMLKDASGNVTGVFAVGRDVTALREGNRA